jgi:hypothetical protein
MNNMNIKLDNDDTVAIELVKCTCRMVQMQLDQATGERLNVGVVLKESETGILHMKFLKDLTVVRYLYGNDAADSASFLIDQAEYAIKSGLELPWGWYVELSEPRFAKGRDIKNLLSDLYRRLVTLGRHHED